MLSQPKFLSVALLAFLAMDLSNGTNHGQSSNGAVKIKVKADKEKKKFKPGELKKYNEVITASAKTQHGLFTVHRIDDKVYFEIPTAAYDRLMLWSTEVAKAPPGVSWGGMAVNHRIVRWSRRGNKVYLWDVPFEKRADGKAVQRAVDAANMASIIMAFPVETEGMGKSAVIHVTGLFTSDVAEFSVRSRVSGASSVDESRSYVDSIKTFPTNIETRSLLTFRVGTGPVPAGATPPRGPRPGGGKGVSLLVHYSLNGLPDRPMHGRFFDPRVGYFTESFEDYAADKTWMVRRQYIARFRLEKKDPHATVSEPIAPIIFYLSREVPEKWQRYLIRGVEDWQPVFEKAGFKNAIFCKPAPSAMDDPNWDPEDARYSVIRWVADPTQNAMGPHVHDPRSGEVISAHIIFWHDILKLVQQWYFVQCGAVDPRARHLPLPDELTGELLRYVATHEVGHTLGLRHNHRASSAFTIAQLRDPKFTDKYGTNASIMSYGRFNYVAQPGDGVRNLIPKLGPYDYFAIEWGYKPISEAKNALDERPVLDQWAARQMEEPWLRFGGEDGPASVDPTVKTENIGDDALEATSLGLKNLDRLSDILVPATTRLGEDYALLEDTYRAVIMHRRNWLNSVARLVGGVVETRSLAGRGNESFTRVSREKQRQAVQFLLQHGFTTPRKLLNPSLINRFKFSGAGDLVLNQQKALLESLLGSERFHQLMDAEVLGNGGCYTAMEFLTDVQDGIWSELKSSQPVVEVCRRHLQRVYLDHLKKELSHKEPAANPPLIPGPRRRPTFSASIQGTDFRAVARAALQSLDVQLAAALPRTQDSMTRVHLRDCRREIELILNPKN
jgi:uncharacterized protein DUF4953/uncharacterized protein DUF5117/uncharacterized protein DUF5118